MGLAVVIVKLNKNVKIEGILFCKGTLLSPTITHSFLDIDMCFVTMYYLR